MISFHHRGSLRKTETFLKKVSRDDIYSSLERYAKEGVDALSASTPSDTGKTASSWDYEIKKDKTGITIYWTNSNLVDGIPVAILIQYGHGTGTGGYVQGIDFINPALRPIFEKIAENVWREVTG